MAQQPQPRLGPQRAQRTEQIRPAPLAQRLPQRVGRRQQGAVLVQQRQRIAHWPAPRLHAIARDGGGLQRVHAPLGLRPVQPDQAVKKIVRVVARGHRALLKNKALIRHARRQRGLRHEAHRRRAGRVQRRRHGLPGRPARQRRRPMRAQRRPPRRAPVDHRQRRCGERRGRRRLRQTGHGAAIVPQRLRVAAAHPSAASGPGLVDAPVAHRHARSALVLPVEGIGGGQPLQRAEKKSALQRSSIGLLVRQGINPCAICRVQRQALIG